MTSGVTRLSKAQEAFAKAKRDLEEAWQLHERFMDEPVVGATLKFQKRFGDGMAYTYLAYHAEDDLWYLTGNTVKDALPWENLIEFIGHRPCMVAESWRWVNG